MVSIAQDLAKDACIDVDLSAQWLRLNQRGKTLFECAVSSAANGAGEQQDSLRTPRGWHEICEKIGSGCPPNTVFVGRCPTGEVYSPALKQTDSKRDWILTRILWLAGSEPGVNQGGAVDTRGRFVYFHGCPDDTDFSVPDSHGCIRLSNVDIVTLFDRVNVGTRVYIHE